MAKFAEITLTNTNLTGLTNTFSVFLKHCSGSTYTTIQTGLTYSDFPYLVNLDNTFGSINCYDYQVSEEITGLICGGQEYTGVTPTNSVTPTPSVTSTPDNTPTSSPTVTPSVTTSTSQTPTTTVTPSVTSTITNTPTITVTPTITSTITQTVTPTYSITPTITPTVSPTTTPPLCYSINVYTGTSYEDVCASSNVLTIYNNTINTLLNGIDVYTDDCISQGGVTPLNVNTYILETGNTQVYSVINTGGTITFIGNCIEPSPTPTITSTVTPSITPSLTPTPSVTSPTGVTINIGAVYSSGSTVATYTLTASTRVDRDTRVEFKNILYDISGNPIEISTGATITIGNITGSTTVTLSGVDYKNIKGYETSFSAFTSSGTLVKNINKYSKVEFINKSTPLMVPWIFTGCCITDGSIEILVPEDATQPGGWVDLGWGVLYNNKCYMAYHSGGNGSYGEFYGPDAKTCSPIYGCESCTDYVKLALKNCCDNTTTVNSFELNVPIEVNDVISFNGFCHQIMGISDIQDLPINSINEVFSGCTECIDSNPSLICPSNTPTPTPSITITPTPTVTPSIDGCINGLDCIVSASTECDLGCYSLLVPYVPRRALNCCDPNDSMGVMVPETLEVGTIVYWNNVCWYIGATTNENENYLLNFEEYSVCEECVGCNAIADCPGGWITCKVSPCCAGAPELPQGAITFEGNACAGDGVIVDGVCYTITTVSDGQASGALIVTQDDIISDICSSPSCSGCTITLESCMSSLGTGGINYFPNKIRLYSYQIPEVVTNGDIILFNTYVQTGSFSVTNTLELQVCYTVIDDDETIPFTNEFYYEGISSLPCSDTNSKCATGYVALRKCGTGFSVLVGIYSDSGFWINRSVGDVIQSIPISSNPYSSTGIYANQTTCYTILEPGSQIDIPQEYAGGGTWSTEEALSVPSCGDNTCSHCLTNVTVTNDYFVQGNIIIPYNDCNGDYNTLSLGFGQTHDFGSECINIISLIQLNFFNVVNENLIINYDVNNFC